MNPEEGKFACLINRTGIRTRLSFLAILAIGILDWIWTRRIGLSIVGWTRSVIAIAIFLLVKAFYSYVRSAPSLAQLAFYGALWTGFLAMGCILTYLAASVSRPLTDFALVAFDTKLGFDWIAWNSYVGSHPVLSFVLRFAYGSLMPQILGSLILFSLARIPNRNEEFLMNAVLALLFTSFLSALYPALGPWVWFGYGGMQPTDTLYVSDVLILRGGQAATFTLTQMQGIICCPSYHTVLAILVIYAHRGLRWSLPPVFAINCLVLLSIPSEGGHYLTDMLAGAGVAVLTMGITHVVMTLRNCKGV